MTKTNVIFVLALVSILVVGTISPALAAQLDARINPENPVSDFSIRYQRTVFIEYPEGGDVADLLRGVKNQVTVNMDSSNPDVKDLMARINDKMLSDGSSAKIFDSNVEYSVTITGRGLSASIDYKIVISGTLTGYTIRAAEGQAPALIDAGWRGISINGPVVIDGTEINMPISAIKDLTPDVYSLMAGSPAELLLSEPIINAEGIKNQPLSNWHFLFDPTGINVDAALFGIAEEISGFVVSGYTMGESSLREGRQVEKVSESQFTVDKTYVVRDIESADSANLSIIGFAVADTLDGTEIFGVTSRAPEGYATTSTGEFPVTIIYGMAGMAGIGAIVMLFFSARKLKHEKYEQTGIDPSQLKAYSTSAGSGGYQTVRGEAQLIDDTSYQKTRSVYEEQKEESAPESQGTKGSLPKGWKPK